MKHQFLRAIVLVTALGIPTLASAGSLTLTMHDGRVTLIAQDVPVRQILSEWARVGQTKIVNADQVFGPNVTMQLVDVPERDALDTVLRSVSGYIAAPRPVALANASLYDRVTIMATSHAPAVSAVPAPPQTFQRPTREDDESVNPALEQQLQEQTQQNLQNMQQRLLQQRTQQASPVVTPYPGMQPPPPGPATGAQPGITPVVTSPRPGALPQTQPGAPNSNQPAVVRPSGPGGGGPGGPGGN